jgi:hypothetical protein
MVGAMAMRGRAKANRAARRKAKRTAENLARRERAAEVAEAEDDIPRVARHVDQLDHLLMKDAITLDMAMAGGRFARDFERSASVLGRLVGRYEADIIRRPRKSGPPPDTPWTIRARQRFEAASDRLGPLWAIVFHVSVTDQPPESWGVQAGYRNGDALALLRLGLAALAQHYGGARGGRADRSLNTSATGPEVAATP